MVWPNGYDVGAYAPERSTIKWAVLCRVGEGSIHLRGTGEEEVSGGEHPPVSFTSGEVNLKLIECATDERFY